MMRRMLVCLLAASAGAYHLPASAKLQQGVKMTAPPPRAMAPAMKKGVLQEVQIDDGNGSRKYVDPASLLLTVDLTPQFTLFFTIMFILEYGRYHPL
ncbi:hypothetical protein EMIHUDRAFT_223849 [Emiliania huxleyi CCMP1516]|uniref:Uncharacterized protein n=2 Tax=Emiliania huxleyi TaxID=2903 RepID=A0A0D3KTB8_EMIH1|nr:hypothetical protein EMIHUDRAFT_223849 [Emiliania huxleyi CCMP1516]EOD39003.1 hypothetical protein EMIHUDRAFT_223849 [Emiliania huxleyi CCMP1516]|eukprot:XP_005791432.1 hypothetical protein EMIHUDRAFT_223849 [Emiliania huxleyi CCMP1516]